MEKAVGDGEPGGREGGDAGRGGRVGLVGCVKSKVGHRTRARDLYCSALFVGRRSWVERTCGRWFILSARHRLVEPEEMLDPYEATLLSASMSERRAWSQQVLAALDQRLGSEAGIVFELHAGAVYRYYGLVEGLLARGARVETPALGLSIGQQLAFYGSGTASVSTRSATGRGTYQPLVDFLRALEGRFVTLSFRDIEGIVGRDLTSLARQHRLRWANSRSGSQRRPWCKVQLKMGQPILLKKGQPVGPRNVYCSDNTDREKVSVRSVGPQCYQVSPQAGLRLLPHCQGDGL